jgi:hypothetical protein
MSDYKIHTQSFEQTILFQRFLKDQGTMLRDLKAKIASFESQYFTQKNANLHQKSFSVLLI